MFARSRPLREGWRGFGGPRGLLGAYALHLLDAQPIYGWELAERIASTTGGGWRPGAGAVYPVLRTLVTQGLARTELRRGRKLYVITPAGRACIAAFRARLADRTRRFGDIRRLMFEMLPPEGRVEWTVEQLRATLEAYVEGCTREDDFTEAQRRGLVRSGRRELERAMGRLTVGGASRRAARGR